MPTRFSGNLPKFFEIECKDPFSQYLRDSQLLAHLISMNKMDHILQDNIERIGRFDEASILDNVWVLEIEISGLLQRWKNECTSRFLRRSISSYVMKTSVSARAFNIEGAENVL